MKKQTIKKEKTISPKISKTKSRKASAKPAKIKLTLAQKQEIKLERQRQREAAKIARGEETPKNKDRFFVTNAQLLEELIKWRDSAKKPEDRIVSEELGQMLMHMADKLLNHSNFRNYSKELKEDMRGYGLYKVIRGFKNYNFNFTNPFAWITQAFFNAYLTIIGKNYKHINIKKSLMLKCMAELEGFNGISPNNSIQRCIKNYLGEDSNGD